MAKLGDLNVSKVAKNGLSYTQTGTPNYAAPEIWKDLPYNYKSDIWSLGCVLYEMTTLNLPFQNKNGNLFDNIIKGEFKDIEEALAWAEGTHCAITVCDLEGKVIFMNERSRATFDKEGRTMLGQNLMPCHSEKSQEKIRHMIATDTVNCYTIDKQGVKKMIYQTPWRRDGKVCGMVEISMVIPSEMPHYVRG